MKALFFNLGGLLIGPTPGGGMKYILQHMTRICQQGHQCTYVTSLVGDCKMRSNALEDLKKKGFSVSSEEMPTIFVDRILGEPFEILAVTFKAKEDINYKDIFAKRTKSKSNQLGASGVFKYRKSYIKTLFSALMHGKVLWNMLEIINKRKELIEQEVYFQDIISYFKSHNQETVPDLFVVEGPVEYMSLALDIVDKEKKTKLVSLIQASYIIAFGPKAMFSQKTSFFSEERLKSIYKSYDGFITPSNYTKKQLIQTSGLDLKVHVIHPLIENTECYLDYKSSFSKEKKVTLINASNFKGLPIFIELARMFPEVNFLAVAGGGIGAKELDTMAGLPNIEVMKPVDPVDPIYDSTNILLVPSLWDETFGMVVVEAMLRGIPVLGSDHGAIPEAKLGVEYLLKVNPYERFTDTFPPKQDISPWAEALESLLLSEELYNKVADKSQIASRSFVEKHKANSIMDYFFTTN